MQCNPLYSVVNNILIGYAITGLLMTRCGFNYSPVIALLPAMAALAAAPSAGAQCRLCPPAGETAARQAERPLSIEVETGIDFSRVAVASAGGGRVEVDAASGRRRVSGGLVDLGGMALSGSVRLSGEPGRGVRISLPERVMLTAPDGSVAELSDIVTDLPPMPRLGPDGRLRFAFGGQLQIKGQVSGNFRGRIPIVADYE